MTLGKVEYILKFFVKEKNPGLEGWTVEFLLVFFDLVSGDLLVAVE